MFRLKRKFAVLVTGLALILPVFGVQSAAASQQNGLVNIYVKDVLNNNQIVLLQNVSIGAAAAFCNINVNVLSAQLSNNQRGNCPARNTTTQRAWVSYS
jgi:hypothetical protein